MNISQYVLLPNPIVLNVADVELKKWVKFKYALII